MNQILPAVITALILTATLQAQDTGSDTSIDSKPGLETNALSSRSYSVLTRDANSKVWAKLKYQTNFDTGEITATTNSYTELATASAHQVQGQWVDYNPRIDIAEMGAQATN